MDDFNTLYNQGFLHFRQGEYTQAQAIFESLIEEAPHPDALRWLGSTLQAQHKFSEAIAVFRQLNALEPNIGASHCGLAVCYDHVGDSRRAGYHYERAMNLSPYVPDMRWNRALHLLSQGDYAQGWQEYAWGYMVPGCRSRRTLAPEWDGSEIPAGQTLFVWAEQGFGDTVQFSRYLKGLRGRVGPDVFIKFECADELLPLFTGAGWDCIDEVISRQIDFSVPGGFDQHVSLLSLPAIFGTTLQTVPYDGPYISAEPQKAASWLSLLNELAKGSLKVGVAWRGNPGHPNDAQRSMRLEDVGAIAGIEGVTLFGLSKSDEAFPYGPDLGPKIKDFGDTAAIIAGLDLVISVDTAIAHLAGAMARLPSMVLILLPQRAEWRWCGIDPYSTPWYPGIHICQCVTHGWQGLLTDLQDRLHHWSKVIIGKRVNP